MPTTEPRVRPVYSRPVVASAGDWEGINPVLQRIYESRGVNDKSGLDYSLAGLLPVSSLSGVESAVQLLRDHVDSHITIVGDFDADGATSTALVMRSLREFGFGNVDYIVPDRFRFGYGLTPEIVAVAAERSPDLLITVDNGVSSIEGVEAAHAAGMRVLITDHHLPGAALPAADAMVNPNLPGNEFSSGNLAGVGVAFYVMAALGRALEADGRAGASRVPARYLDLVALGTVADVVRLDYNNRVLVEQGLKRIRAGRAVPGIEALFRVSSRQASRAISTDLGFVAGPRLNAAGRLEDMSTGIECLLTDDSAAADRLAAALDGINKERKEIEAKMRQEAFAYVDAMDATDLPACVCLYDEHWHQGVVGLIAARVRERCDRPVIAFAKESDGKLKGSGRSISGVHIRDLLEAVSTAEPGLIEKFGGHAMAAGLTLTEANFDRFAKLAADRLAALWPDADFSGGIMTDGPLPPESLNLGFARELRTAGPWGAGFPEPSFTGDFDIVSQRVVGENHLKMQVRSANGGPAIDAIAFGQAGPSYRGTVQLAYRLDVNEFRGIESPQLIVEQIVKL